MEKESLRNTKVDKEPTVNGKFSIKGLSKITISTDLESNILEETFMKECLI